MPTERSYMFKMESAQMEDETVMSISGAQRDLHTCGGAISEPFLDAAEAGQFLRFHPKTVMLLARQGKLPGYPIGDGPRKHWLFLRSELDIWVRSKVHSGGHPCS
jgi:hypothetical protein